MNIFLLFLAYKNDRNFDQYSLVQKDIDKQFKKTVIDAIGITPEFTETQKAKLAEEYSNNMKLYIKDFADNEIAKLRGLVEDNTFSGMRADKLQNIIRTQFDVSDRKAKFLAKQETSLITAKYRESRYFCLRSKQNDVSKCYHIKSHLLKS